MPVSVEERLNMLLDAGFDPKKLSYLGDLAWQAYSHKRTALKKKLNITVRRPTWL